MPKWYSLIIMYWLRKSNFDAGMLACSIFSRPIFLQIRTEWVLERDASFQVYHQVCVWFGCATNILRDGRMNFAAKQMFCTRSHIDFIVHSVPNCRRLDWDCWWKYWSMDHDQKKVWICTETKLILDNCILYFCRHKNTLFSDQNTVLPRGIYTT